MDTYHSHTLSSCALYTIVIREFRTSQPSVNIVGGDRVVADLAPVTSKGVAGDRKGMIATDALYYHVCTADYTTGSADIWSRNLLATGTWS